jgi:AcrR family transcriptional regulator
MNAGYSSPVSEIRRGRPRSERATAAVLEATRDLLREVGYEKLTMDGIAARAGVSKMTIYRWWSTKSAIVAEAVLSGTIAVAPMSIPTSDDLRADLGAWLATTVGTPTPPELEALALGMAAAATGDIQSGAELYTRFTGVNREALLNRLQRAAAEGEIAADRDLGTAADALFGVILFRLITRAPADMAYAEALTSFVLDGLGVRSPTEPGGS